MAATAGLIGGCSGGDSVDGGVAGISHQPGVVTPPPADVVLVAIDVVGTPGAALRSLTGRVEQAVAAGVEATLALGASLFDARFGLAAHRPPLLTTMPQFPNDVLDPAYCHGDLLLQVCGDGADQVAAVADDVLKTAGSAVRVRWRMAGFRAENGVTAAGQPSTRNLFGFREGAGNPDPADENLMNQLVWTEDGGTYQVVRLIRFATDLWNRDSVPEQELMIGRHRDNGTPLQGGPEDATFDYSADPAGQLIPLDAHIRRANPRTPQTRATRILRRGYSYQNASDEGLLFICFQRDPDQGFAAVQRRLAGEALDRYVLPFGGGYFFVPPSPSALNGLLTD
ncbi:Dyp-type peroxidase [Actinoplanes sp. NBRC 101535]|uniref:Dyp-type peroxidase n=1 Tax=Actinoplanes sp. NBRC 101535 TaxID=3032196 RepID=UPI002557AEC6|nr:Dyp-type peroxidase [Actinoplanes sp. NBRC 101535]